MAQNVEVNYCAHCYRLAEMGGHNEGCPIAMGTKEAMDEWQKGYNRGFEDDFIPWYSLQNYSSTFQFGYHAGCDGINNLIESVIEKRNNWGERE